MPLPPNPMFPAAITDQFNRFQPVQNFMPPGAGNPAGGAPYQTGPGSAYGVPFRPLGGPTLPPQASPTAVQRLAQVFANRDRGFAGELGRSRDPFGRGAPARGGFGRDPGSFGHGGGMGGWSGRSMEGRGV
ncbi:MAG: hypothetical protein ACREEP_08245 [Dongiaceae bacterium]